MSRSIQISVNDSSQVGLARREAASLARALSLTPAVVGKVEIAVTEAAGNLLKHAERGKILLRVVDNHTLEMMAVDKGPGMKDVAKCMQDGYSTAGSPGTGLGGIARLANLFDIYTQPGQGSVVLAQFGQATGKPLVTGAVCVASNEGDPCGDDWAVLQRGHSSQALVVDGLGHGLFAAQAAEQAVKTFEELGQASTPLQVVQGLHGPMRSTRGASLAVAEIDFRQSVVRYSGVGNISGVILTGDNSRSMVSHNGTVGHELRRVQEFQYPWAADSTLIMHSDGLLTRWKLDGYPGLIARHPSLIAAVLYRDFQRGRDDVTVLVVREGTRNRGV